MNPPEEQLLAAASRPLHSIPDVIDAFEAIDKALADDDGLKWFNWLYLAVTRAVDVSMETKTRHNAAWMERLDVVFASLYLDALKNWLTAGGPTAGCWAVLFRSRRDMRLARIQFALAGMNAHIDHDLAIALTTTCAEFNIIPRHLSGEYQDYCGVNELLDSITEMAKRELLTGLACQKLPAIALVENLASMWGLRATREAAWTNGEMLWGARLMPGLPERFLAGLDRAATLAGRGLLAPVGI